MRSIRVLQITHDLNIGGLQRVVVDIAKNLDKEAFQAGVLCLRNPGPLTKELDEDNIPVFSIPHKSKKTDYLSFLKTYSIIKGFKPDVIHTHNTQPFIDGTLAGLMARVPVKIHTDHARDFPDKKRYMLAEWLFSHLADRIVGVSKHTKNNLINYEKINPHKIDIIHNGVDGRKYDIMINLLEKKKQLGIENKYPILGLGVRFTKQKGITYLIRAVSAMKQKFPEICVLIAGEGPLQKTLEKEAEGLALSRHIRFVGPRSDMNEILKVIDIYVLPSLWEGLPLVILEAMAAQKPIVATDVGGNSEVIQHSVNGMLVPPGRPDLLADQICALLKNENKMRQMAINAWQSYKESYSVSVMVGKYTDLYARLLGR